MLAAFVLIILYMTIFRNQDFYQSSSDNKSGVFMTLFLIGTLFTIAGHTNKEPMSCSIGLIFFALFFFYTVFMTAKKENRFWSGLVDSFFRNTKVYYWVCIVVIILTFFLVEFLYESRIKLYVQMIVFFIWIIVFFQVIGYANKNHTAGVAEATAFTVDNVPPEAEVVVPLPAKTGGQPNKV